MRTIRRLATLASASAALLLAAGGCGGASDPAERGVTATPAAGPAASNLRGAVETERLLDGIPQDGLVLGDKNAPVTILEIVDLQCPFCRQHQLDVLPKMLDELVRPGRVQLHLVPVAFLGPSSQQLAVVALRMAQRDRAWHFANLHFWNQERAAVSDAYLRDLVTSLPGAQRSDADELASTTPDEEILRTAQAASLIAQTSVGRVGGGGTPFFTAGPTGTAAQDLTPILTGAPPESYATLLAAVEAIEAGRAPKALPRAPRRAPTA